MLICKLNKINRENIFNFFFGYELCELFVLFGLTSCRLFVNSILIGYNVYPSLNLQTSECKSQYKNVGLGQYKNVGFPTFLYCLFSLHLLWIEADL